MADAITFPAWFKPEEGAPPVYYLTEAAVPKGWIHVPGDYNRQTGQWVGPDPLDHGGNGQKGDRASAPDDLKTLRAAYKAKFGKKAFNGWDEAKLREKLA